MKPMRRYRTLRSRRRAVGFTLIEIMIVVGILAIIIGIAGPTWIRQREISQLRVCQENLTKINGAKEQWAMENNEPSTAEPDWDDLLPADGDGYLKVEPTCPASGTYTLNNVNVDAECSINDPDHNQDPSQLEI
jgi:prepilin-type N-terminal cleavage/methylation domain-containing protein